MIFKEEIIDFEFDQRNCNFYKLLFSLRIFFDENNVAKLAVKETIAIGCHSLCCFLPRCELVETMFLQF